VGIGLIDLMMKSDDPLINEGTHVRSALSIFMASTSATRTWEDDHEGRKVGSPKLSFWCS
jgi:hypothetical protein